MKRDIANLATVNYVADLAASWWRAARCRTVARFPALPYRPGGSDVGVRRYGDMVATDYRRRRCRYGESDRAAAHRSAGRGSASAKSPPLREISLLIMS